MAVKRISSDVGAAVLCVAAIAALFGGILLFAIIAGADADQERVNEQVRRRREVCRPASYTFCGTDGDGPEAAGLIVCTDRKVVR